MNTRKCRAEFKNFRIILDSRFSSTILMRSIVLKLGPEKYAVMQYQTQARNIATNFKVWVDFTLPALRATNVVTWKCHVDNFARGRYDMILGRGLWTELVLNIKNSEHVIEADDGPFIGSTAHMADLVSYVFKYLNTRKIKQFFRFNFPCI